MADEAYVPPFNDDVEAIADDVVLLRRVPPSFIDWESLDEDGAPRITSGGFQDYPAQRAQHEFGLPGACMSVSVLDIVLAEGRDPEELLVPYGPTNGFAQLTAGAARACSQGVHMDPRPGEPWHAVVFAKTKAKKDNTMKSCLAGTASWHTPPRDRPPSP